MKIFVACVIGFAVLITASDAKKVVCYYRVSAIDRQEVNRVEPEDINPNWCTHINIAFALLDENGTIYPDYESPAIDQKGYERVAALKQKNPNLKILLSIGGGDAGPQMFVNTASDPVKRATMIKSARSYMETYGFDGIDIDWEFPTENDKEKFVTLLQEFKNDFSQNGWLLTIATPADIKVGYDVDRMSDILDHINVMTYDMYGPWSAYTGQNSPLYASSVETAWEKANLNLAAATQQWIDAGVSLDKIIAGLAFYGRSYTLKDPNNNGLHAPYTGLGIGGPFSHSAGMWSYLEFCDQADFWSCAWDDEQKNPICVNGDQWLAIDNKESISDKVDYINAKGLGGAMIWAIDCDDFHGHCDSSGLLETINERIH